MANAGDVNGDGFSDWVAGGDGVVMAWRGVAIGSFDRMLVGPTGSAFGAAVGGAGDIDGDGFSDVIVGAPLYTAGEASEGAVAQETPTATRTW